MKKLTNMQRLRLAAKEAKAEYGTDIKVSLDGKVYFRRVLISDWHRQMWEWLAEHPDKDKIDFFESRILGRKHSGYVSLLSAYNLCFACYYNDIILGKSIFNGNTCRCCPFGESVNCCCGGLYDAYKDVYERGDYEEVRNLARQIANLEWKWRDGNKIRE